MDAPKCPLCGSRDNQKQFAERGHDLCRCAACDLFFIDPYPTDMDDRHDRVKEYRYEDLEVIDTDKQYRGEVQFYERYFGRIGEECRGAASVLDVGCGTGRLLELIGRDPNVRREGIELNTARAEAARRRTGCTIHQVPVEEFAADRRFDVITMINVLSHIPSFDSLFRGVRNLLTDRGKFIIKVGEVAPDVQKGDLHDWELGDHLHFLGLRTIDVAAKKFGFTVARHDRVPISEDLFSRTRWKMPGRSGLRDAIKSVVVVIPLALPLLRRVYEWRHGRRIYSSLIVLTPSPGQA